MKSRFIYSILSVFTLITFFNACRKTNPIPPNPNEEELITTCRLVFVDSAGVLPTSSFEYEDIDGDGGNPPSTFDTIRLKSGTTYYTEILLLDESKSPVDTVSNEVFNEGDEHLFCFTVSGLNCPIQRTDSDGTYEIGLLSKWKPGATGTGSVQVELRHQPDTKDGTCTPGSTDLSIVFPFSIQ
ncbi:MAG: hypothetical protein JNM44_09310 [Chitinophagaceae bacterium]|nr:hypothetical protein [Chitinophagaceae bacterium]